MDYLAVQGIEQFLDLGSGLPTQNNVHEVAQRWTRGARTVYVDNDPVVLAHARALLCTDSYTRAIDGDLRQPGDILDQLGKGALLDLCRPVAVLMVAVLHFIGSDDQATEIVAAFRDAVADGSYLVISHPTGDFSDPEAVERAQAVYTKAGINVTPRSKHRVQRMFGDLQLIPPGLLDVRDWHASCQAVSGQTTFYGGVGYKDGTR